MRLTYCRVTRSEGARSRTIRIRVGRKTRQDEPHCREDTRQLRTPLTNVNIMAVRYMIAMPVNMPADTCTRRVAVYDITVSESTT